MPDNEERNPLHDPFGRYMQQRLKEHPSPPDDACWEEIGQRLDKRRKALFIRRSLYVAAAVAVIALVLIVNIPQNHRQEDALPLATTVEQPDTINETVIPREVATDTPAPRKKNRKVTYTATAETPEKTETTTVEEPVATEEAPVTKEEAPVTKEEAPVTREKPHSDPPVQNRKRIMPPSVQKKKRRDWQASAGFNANGAYSLAGRDNPKGNVSHEDFTNGGGWIPSNPDLSGSLQPADYDDIDYNVPLSFGITVRRKLTNRLSVETGLVYTYLSTNFKRNTPNAVKGKLGLHYLGIPVNLSVDLWDNRHWNVYVSAGVMGEKGLRSVYTQHVYRSTSTTSTTLKSSIPDMQWSLNGAVGVSYRLHKDWSLYAEPRVSYFFDNNQPISVRTEKPVSLGLGVGVRFDFHTK